MLQPQLWQTSANLNQSFLNFALKISLAPEAFFYDSIKTYENSGQKEC